MTPAELFGTFRESAFRLETLQYYVLAEDEPRRRAFREGRPLPPRPGKTDSMRLVRDAVARGRRVRRVHVVDLPLSDYIRYELAVYPENVAAGEDVRIARRAAHPGLGKLDTDFWLFDAGTDHAAVVWFRYTPGGDLITREYSDDPGDVGLARDQQDLALAHSVPITEFMAPPAAG
jgi:Family of unknown function (DUF6879)